MKKKIVFMNGHFQRSDGTVSVLIDLCNSLDPEKFDITILPIYRCDRSLASRLRPDIKLKKAFGFYFPGLSRLAHMIPGQWLYRWLLNGKYDIEVGFQCGIPTKLVGMCKRPDKVQAAWMHTYDNFPQYYRNVDQVVCVSKCNADRCRRELPFKANVTYCYNLMNDEKICRMGQEPAEVPQGDGPLLVTVGRVSPEKGFVRLVKVLAQLKEEGYAFRLMIVGDGPQMPELRETVQGLHMEDRVTLVGKQSNPHRYTARADLFICSSFSEGYSTACGEAAILNVPIVTTDVAGGREIIDTCGCGSLCGMDDDSLRDAIRSVLRSPEILDQWKQTLSITKKEFGLEVRKKAITDLFDRFYDLSEQRNSEPD